MDKPQDLKLVERKNNESKIQEVTIVEKKGKI